MFNIHLVREPWRDIPTAKALARVAADIKERDGSDPSDAQLRELTGLSIERVRRLRYVMTLPEEWQRYIEAYSQTGIIYIKTRQPRRAYMKAACFSK
jgi:ParB family transcriptional regulator, chromosome partitioning protein